MSNEKPPALPGAILICTAARACTRHLAFGRSGPLHERDRCGMLDGDDLRDIAERHAAFVEACPLPARRVSALVVVALAEQIAELRATVQRQAAALERDRGDDAEARDLLRRSKDIM